jgi:small subunit ribosomal protein S3
MKERIFIKKAKEQIQLEEMLRKEFADVKCGLIEIAYTPLGVRVIIHTTSPGLVIGHGGDKIREVSEKLRKLGIENPQIDVQKISNPDIDPMIVSQSIAAAMTRGMNVKKIGNYYLDRVMRAGAIGCEIVIKGKISGEKARSERFITGYLKKCGEPAMRDVVKAQATALPKLGTIGITTSIMITHSDRKIIVERPQVVVEKMEEAQVEAEKAEAAAKSEVKTETKPEAKTEAKTE